MKTTFSAAIATLVFTSAMAAAPASTTTAESTATPVQTETTKVAEVAPNVNPLKNVILAIDSENVKTLTSQSAATYAGDIEAYQYLKTGYKVNDKTSVMMVNTWTQRYGYKENSAETTFGDLQLRATRSDVLNIGKMKFSGQGRVYLPTSRASNYQDQVAQLRAYLIGSQALTNKLSLGVIVNPRYYIQENKDFINERGQKRNTADFRMFNSVGLKYSLSDALAVESTVGVFSIKAHNTETAHLQDFSTSAYYTVSKNISLNGGIRSSLTTDIDTEGVELYNHHNSEYFLIASVGL